MVTLSPLFKLRLVALVEDKSKGMQNDPSIDSWKKAVIWVKLSKEVGLETFVMKTAAITRI